MVEKARFTFEIFCCFFRAILKKMFHVDQ